MMDNPSTCPGSSTTKYTSLKSDQPIGIFDSGIGGLTVASAISKLMPNEKLIYFGDTAHHPYGDKSPDSIRRYSKEIARFLEMRNCKVILVACNTASAQAYHTLCQAYAKHLVVMDVIYPVVKHVAENYKEKRIGVIATKGTVISRIYPRRIKKINSDTNISTLATPLLAPMIEEGFFNNNISRAVVDSYLSKNALRGIEVLILGCTHYPLIRGEVEHYFGSNFPIIDSAECTANFLLKTLIEYNLLSDLPNGDHEFYVSDYTDAFEHSSKLFFGNEIHLQKINIWSP
jgi:glutamate racemase